MDLPHNLSSIVARHRPEALHLPANSSDLDDLLAEPRETLDIEVKEWLDITNNDHRATVAKEIIALANHGGGYLIVGFREGADGAFMPAENSPANLEVWSQDAIQSIVARYIDPAIQCRVSHRPRPGTNILHPIIAVPGGQRIPVRAKAGSPSNVLVPHRTYIRRAGPASEEPQTGEEWDRLLERCLQNRKSELQEAMRSILEGVVPVASPRQPTRLEELLQFEHAAIVRWSSLVSPLPADSHSRFPLGYVDFGAAIDGTFDTIPLPTLRDVIDREVRNYSGWPPFVTINRAPFAPRAVDGTVEFWRGTEEHDTFDKPDHHDFWRVSPSGLFFTRRGYAEDSWVGRLEPGTGIDITSPTWKLGEAILEVGFIARALNVDDDSNLILHCAWHGLAGRELVSERNPNRTVTPGRTAAQTSYEKTAVVRLGALPGSLPELVFEILSPLYELFDFFQLPKRLVEEELAQLRSRRR
jgi:hypothetical protein